MADAAVETTTIGCCLVARVSGAMEFQTDRVLRARFKELIARVDRVVVLDLSGVSFCDSVGLGVLIAAWQQAEASGAVLVVACVPESLRLTLQISGVHQLLRAFDTVADAEAVLDC
ncbi:STAS domain-containing protein [Streptomyces chartreusis]|uniref:STAS domain-containing protein n=1 Tax=Streptomyces chartreusis TaxID=1969 RepID=UPI00365AC2F6